MSTAALIVVCAVLATGVLILWLRLREAVRAQYIRDYTFPPGLFERLQQKRPSIDAKQFQLVARALRQFFLAHLRGGFRLVSMPSQVADDLWHEFILYTRHYEQFCHTAFGRFMHHTPAVVLSRGRVGRVDNEGLRRVWWHCCREENINPRKPTRLPLLFALDAKLGIADGFTYVVDCSRVRRETVGHGGNVHCAGDFASADIDGTTDGLGDASDGGDGGCSGGGCGGGD